MTRKELRELQLRIATNARSKLDEITDNTTAERAAEIEVEFDAMMAEHDQHEAKIERLDKLAEAEERANAPDPRRPRGNDGQASGVDDGEPITYEVAFRSWLANGGDKSGMKPEERSVLERGYSALPKEQRAQTTTAAAGGYTIPEEMRPELVRSMLAFGPMYDPGISRELVTAGGNPMPFPTVNDTANTGAAGPGEGVTLTDDGGKDVVFGEKQLDAYSFDTEWLRVSLELSQDSAFDMSGILGGLLGERLGRTANTQLTTGTGSSAPNGVVTASTLGKLGASITVLTGDELIDLQHAVDPAYRQAPGVRWMFNDTTYAAIRKLKDGDGNYLWQMGNVQIGAPGSLLGSPYSVNQAVANIGTLSRSVLYGDFGKYWVRKIANMPLIGAIQDKDFWPGFGIAGYIRFDGELSDTAAIKHLAHPTA